MTKLTDCFTVAVAEPAPSGQPRTQLLRDGKPTGTVLDGAVLEGAVDFAAGYLLFLTDDTPFEESLRILLIDKNLREKDRAELAIPYSSGVFSKLRVLKSREVAFRFLGTLEWRAHVFARPRLALFWPVPIGTMRPWRIWRHFEITQHPITNRRD